MNYQYVNVLSQFIHLFQEKVKLTKPLHITVQDVDTELSIN